MANTLKLGAGKWATGTDTVLSFNDENNNFKPLPFSFSRASSATVVNQSGLIETVGSGEPRIDFKDNTKGALLLEPSRTNIIPYSEDFSNASWTKSGASISSDVITSPDGSLNADKIVEGTSTGEKFTQAIITVSNATIYTASVFVKFAGREWIRLTDAQSSNRIHFNTKTGVFGSATGTVINYKSTLLGDGWYKLSLTTTSVATAYAMRIVLAENDNDVSYTGDGTSGVYIWGAQLEVGSYATSYIPTSGSAVTRVVDACSQTVPDGVIGQTEGTMYAEINIPSIESVGTYTGFNIFNFASPSANKISIDFYNTGRVQATSFSGSSLVVNIDITNYGLTSGIHKMAFAYKLNDYILYIDGSIVGSDTSATVPSTDILDLYNTSGTNSGSLNHNEVKLYNTRLSNAELQALTTI